MPQLNTRCISASATLPARCSQSKIGGTRPGAAVDPRAESIGEHPMRVLDEPAARDVRHALDVELAQERQHGLHVDARRLEQRVAERAVGRQPGHGRAQVRARNLEDLRTSEKPFECGPARREAEEHVAGSDAPAVDRVRLLDDADREAREVVLARRGNAFGCSAVSPPISAQPACSQPAAMPFHDVGGDRDVEALADEVVEEEQRLGALHEDVVDAHRDEVDADRVVPRERERELELRADAVGAGDEHRLAIALAAARRARRSRRCRPAPRGAACARANGLIRSTSASPASMSTPASRYDSGRVGAEAEELIGRRRVREGGSSALSKAGGADGAG